MLFISGFLSFEISTSYNIYQYFPLVEKILIWQQQSGLTCSHIVATLSAAAAAAANATTAAAAVTIPEIK